MWNKDGRVNEVRKEPELCGETDMQKKAEKNTRQHLSKEILGLFGVTTLIAVFFYLFMSTIANSLILNYADNNHLEFTVYEMADIGLWIQSISIVFSVILFVVLFLFLVGERIAYITEIIKGIDALGRHDWAYEIPLEGDNELTELAERVNALSKEEQAFQEKERQMREEKESLVRALSHDIRTPLTSILSYSEYMKGKKDWKADEIADYIVLMEQKAQQIKVLTDRLLDGGSRHLEVVENGKFLMKQLVDEWETEIEDEFNYHVYFTELPDFCGAFDVQELRRIFDNLASNVKKYARKDFPVGLHISTKDGRLCIYQTNGRKQCMDNIESTKIGINSIRKIAENYGGTVEVELTEQQFSIEITLVEISYNL